MMSTPRASAARAKPHATASWRATPPRACSSPPTTGKRAVGEQSSSGTMRATSSRPSIAASIPLRRMALPRRLKASSWGSLWARLMTPRWLNMTL
jgi:hypothetical protein